MLQHKPSAFVLRQEFGEGRQVGGELFGQQIGRIDNEHAAAVHTEAVAARGVGMQFGLQPMGSGQFVQFGGQLAAFFARKAGIPQQIAAGGEAAQGSLQGFDYLAVVLFLLVGRIDED